jgi:hypothetical protein
MKFLLTIISTLVFTSCATLSQDITSRPVVDSWTDTSSLKHIKGSLAYNNKDSALYISRNNSWNRLSYKPEVDAGLATKLNLTGGNMTGGLGIQYAAGNKHLIAMNLGGTSSAGSKGFDVSSYYLGFGHREWGVGTYRLMGFGFRYNFTDHYPAIIGYQETSGSSSTYGDLIFATRNVTSNTAPTIRLRITGAGNTKVYGPVSAPEDVATKGYVDTAYMPTKTITFTGTYSLNGTPSNTFVRNNANAANTITLPTAKDGITYTIWKIGGSVMTLSGAIVDAGKTGSKVVSGTEAGSTITVICSENSWVILSKNGTWTTQ